MNEPDRQNAILTTSQRKFLSGNGDDPTSANGRMKRSRIKRRAVAAVEDMELLAKELSEKDRKSLRNSISQEQATRALEAYKDVFGVGADRSAEGLRKAAKEIEAVAEAIEDE